MKNILLIRPPEKYLPHRESPMAYFPIGLLQIAAVLKEKGLPVEIIDGIMPQQGIKEGENFFGITFEEISKRIQKKEFDIVGIGVQFTFQWENALKTAQVCKEINPHCKVIVGGAHASTMFEKILAESTSVDIVVRGEGEVVLPNLIDRLRSNQSLRDITGIAFREDNKIITNEAVHLENLDSLPFPAYDLIDLEKYFSLIKQYPTRTSYEFPGSERAMTLITSRGCPYTCVFCSIHLHMGRKWRAHCAEYVLKHIEMLVNEYNVKYLHFEDDNFSFDRKRIERILNGIIEKKLDIRWDTPNGVRVDTFDKQLLEKCKNTGCTHLIFGIESGQQRVLDEVIKKRIQLNKCEEILGLAREVGVDTRAFYMAGLPGEKKEEIKASFKYALHLVWKYECFGGFSMAVPLLGTELFDICQDGNLFLKEPSIENLSQAFLRSGIIKTDEFDPDLLGRCLKNFSSRVKMLKYLVLIRKLCADSRLLVYILDYWRKNSFKKFTEALNKVIFFHHAIIYDLEKAKNG